MTLAAAWVLFPLLLLAATTGWGFLVASAAGSRLPAPLLPAVGLAALTVALTLTSAAAPAAALPVTIAGALAGVALRRRPAAGDPAPDASADAPLRLTVVAAAIAFALVAAPVVLTGAPAIAGYIRLDDSATFLALGDWVLAHGHDTSGLTPSTFEAAVSVNLDGGYPTGAVLPLVAVGRLSGVDLAWAYMPYLAVLAGMLAAAIEVVLRPLAARGAVRVLIAVIAAGSALLVGFILWGGVKEIWASALAVSLAALVPGSVASLRDRRGVGLVRPLLPLGVGAAALASGLTVAGIGFAFPVFAVLAAGVVTVRGGGRRVLLVVVAALVTGVALVPLVRLAPFAENLFSGPQSGPDALGNLLRPLRIWQVLGIWPARDFRIDAVSGAGTTLLLVAVLVGAGWGLWRAISLRAWGVLAMAGTLASAAAILVTSNWPWAESKALAIASPVPLALAGAGAAQLLAARRPRAAALGGLLLAALTFGVAWSYALAFQGTTLTPHDRHEELARIGERYAGRGPALATEFDAYAGRWFLRRLDAEVAGELRRRQVSLRGGGTLSKGESADIDRFELSALDPYRLLVLRRSPAASRPPSSFERVWRGRWYEVWERRTGRPVNAHLALGNAVDPTGVPACADVLALARIAGEGGLVRAAVAAQPAVARFDPAMVPRGWKVANGVLYPDGRGTGTGRAIVTLPTAGRYEVWVGGAFRGGATVAVDGVTVGTDRHQLSYTGNWVPFGATELSAGPHAVTVRLDGGGLHPGVHGVDRYPIGPVALVPLDRPGRLLELPPNDAGALCGRRLDWVEAVR